MTLVSTVYHVTGKFPHEELFGLTSQLRRAAIAIPLNIAEGSGGKSDAEFARYLRISVCSLYELITGFEIAFNLGYVEERVFNNILTDSNALGAMTNALVKKLSTSKANS